MNTDKRLWEQMFSPTNSKDELTELKNVLSTSGRLSNALEQFLYAEYMNAIARSRAVSDPVVSERLLSYAHSLAELSGLIFSAPKQTKTTETHFSV